MLPPKIKLKNDVFWELLVEKTGGVAGFLRAWSAIYEDDVPDRSTIYAWRDTGRLPQPFTRCLRAARVLDVDPVLLIDFDGRARARVVETFMRIAMLDQPTEKVPVREALTLYGPSPDWPNEAYLSSESGQSLFTKQFKHEGTTTDFYQTVELQPLEVAQPIVWHFAYLPGGTDNWRPYGFVVQHKGIVRLNNFYSDSEVCEHEAELGGVLVSTWFGRGSCEFKVASVHPFQLSLAASDKRGLRFEV